MLVTAFSYFPTMFSILSCKRSFKLEESKIVLFHRAFAGKKRACVKNDKILSVTSPEFYMTFENTEKKGEIPCKEQSLLLP